MLEDRIERAVKAWIDGHAGASKSANCNRMILDSPRVSGGARVGNS